MTSNRQDEDEPQDRWKGCDMFLRPEESINSKLDVAVDFYRSHPAFRQLQTVIMRGYWRHYA